jgi:hypothetical protein
MESLLLWIGRIAGIVGVVVCAAAAVARASAIWGIAGVPVGTVFQAGMAAMILACLAYVSLLTEGARK